MWTLLDSKVKPWLSIYPYNIECNSVVTENLTATNLNIPVVDVSDVVTDEIQAVSGNIDTFSSTSATITTLNSTTLNTTNFLSTSHSYIEGNLWMNSGNQSIIVGNGSISCSGPLTAGSLNGITIPSSGGTLAKLSDISGGTSNLGVYSNGTSLGYTFSGSTTPATMTFATTEQQTGVTVGSSNSFTVGATGTYQIQFDGYCYSTSSILYINLHVYVNGSSVDSATARLDTAGTFRGKLTLNSVINLNSGDVVTIRIAPDTEPTSLQFGIGVVGNKNGRLVIRKL